MPIAEAMVAAKTATNADAKTDSGSVAAPIIPGGEYLALVVMAVHLALRLFRTLWHVEQRSAPRPSANRPGEKPLWMARIH